MAGRLQSLGTVIVILGATAGEFAQATPVPILDFGFETQVVPVGQATGPGSWNPGGGFNGGANIYAAHAACHRSQQRQWLMARARQERVTGPDGIEAQALSSLSQFQQRRRLWLSCHDALPRRQQISDTNGHGVLRSDECCLLEGHGT